MAMPYFPTYHSPSAPADSLSSVLTIKSKLTSRTLTIANGKSKPVRKVRNLAKLPASCAWYEAEDRNLPSVSSF
jgi:hypothetical protein